MKGNEFIKRVKILAKQRGVKVKVDEKRDKGSHVTLYRERRSQQASPLQGGVPATLIRNLQLFVILKMN